MSRREDWAETSGIDLLLGLSAGLIGGALLGLLYAPKEGRQLQQDVQSFVNQIPDEVNHGLIRSKDRYYELVDKTKEGIGNQMEQLTQRKQAMRMADAKRREELESGADY